MRVYHSKSHRLLSGGSVEIEGRWSGVQWLALGLLPLLPLVARSLVGLSIVALAAVALALFPARRRVVFDAGGRRLRVEHAGFGSEDGRIEIPFANLRSVVFQRAGRKGGRPLFALFALDERGEGRRTYLCTHAGERDTATLERALTKLLQERS
jgi:hypothetical protein